MEKFVPTPTQINLSEYQKNITTPSQINLSNLKNLYIYLYEFIKKCSFLSGTEKYSVSYRGTNR